MEETSRGYNPENYEEESVLPAVYNYGETLIYGMNNYEFILTDEH